MNETSDTSQQPVVLTFFSVAAYAAAMAVVMAVLAPVTSSTPGEIGFGTVAALCAVGALSNYRTRYIIADDRLIAVRVFSRRTLVLSELRIATVVRMKASRGRVAWHLILEDRYGTEVRLNLAHTQRSARHQFLSILAFHVMAPTVEVSGPMLHALTDQLW